jgi:large subunit ribosomal protein L21
MYAVVEISGRQWRVEPGTQLTVNRVGAEAGATHVVDRVLMASDGKVVKIGRPYCAGAKVVCEVLSNGRGPKVITYKFRRRENWRKTRGHRQDVTKLLVKDISL